MTESQRLSVRSDRLRQDLLPLLRHSAFHVTTLESYESIRNMGRVLAVPPDRLPATPMPYDGFFRSIGCVSVCDLTAATDAQVEFALDAYFFLDPRHGQPDPVFLLLNDDATRTLISNREAVEMRVGRKMLVPHIEAGYRGDIPFAAIREAIIVEIQRPPPSPFVEAFRADR